MRPTKLILDRARVSGVVIRERRWRPLTAMSRSIEAKVRGLGRPRIAPHVPASPHDPVEHETMPDYLTDGSDLYRFLGWVSRSRKAKLAVLENCRSLSICLASTNDSFIARLQPVVLGPSPAGMRGGSSRMREDG